MPASRLPGVDPLAMRLMAHYEPMSRYQWVLKIDGTYATYDHPTVDEVNAATEAYSGPTTVSSTVATALTAAGYGAYLT